MFGKILSLIKSENTININFENGEGIIDIITPGIINVYSSMGNEKRESKAIEEIKREKCNVEVNHYKDKIHINTGELKIEVFNDFMVDFYNKSGEIVCEDYRGVREPFERTGSYVNSEGEGIIGENTNPDYEIQVMKQFQGDENFYGLGDKTGHLNKKNYYYEMWNTDNASPHVEGFKTLYKTIPFFITLREKMSYGIFFDNTFKSYFDMGKENEKYFYFAANQGNLNYYFIYGPEVKNVINGYTYLTGTAPMQQRWVLGYQQSRWSYGDEKTVLNIAKNFRKKEIPCDVIHLDIDYMDGYRVFTWDTNKFKNPEKFTEKLKQQGFKIVTIIDPGVKKEKGYSVFDEGLKNGYFATEKDGIPYVNEVWPGDAMYPDFSKEATRMWWGRNQSIMTNSGVSGIWNDMNEPASFNGPLPDDVQFENNGQAADHREIHNVYGHLMSKATYEGLREATAKRPFVITRACYAGSQKYTTVWTGDNQSFWEHLRLSVPMLLNLGLSGISFCGTDVGGFSFDCTAELLSRWVQVGAFSPLFRNHSCIKSRAQEPWAFDKTTEKINKKYINLRYQLIPYLYDLMWECENTGMPIMRPLFLSYEKDQNTYNINDEFLSGESILVAPILEQGKTARAVYLPKGHWYDYWTGEKIEGGKNILKEAPLDVCPIYVKAGAIIPNYPVQNYIGEKEIDELILDIYPGDGEYLHYQDDGESFNYRQGEYNIYNICMKQDENIEINISMVNSGYPNKYKSLLLKAHCSGGIREVKKEFTGENIHITI